MQINVSQLLKEPIGSTRNYEINTIIDITDGGGNKVEGEVMLTRTNRGILVEGVLHTEVEVTCSRCLNLFRCPLILNIEEEYFPTIEVSSGAPLSVVDDAAGSFTIDEHHVLDLTEAIRQYALLAIPMKPLCRADCAGLCPSCDRDLNKGTCNCPSQEPDPRWAKLKVDF